MALGGTAMGVTTSDQTNLHTDSVPNALNTNRSVYANNYNSIQNTFSLKYFRKFVYYEQTPEYSTE